jgi:hypothetical protein
VYSVFINYRKWEEVLSYITMNVLYEKGSNFAFTS